jgi:hypothetical protein
VAPPGQAAPNLVSSGRPLRAWPSRTAFNASEGPVSRCRDWDGQFILRRAEYVA